MADGRTAVEQPDIDRIMLIHRQDEPGKCASCGTVWPCQVFNEATAARAGTGSGNGAGKVSLVDLLPWRAIVYLANKAGKRTDRAVFCCGDADEAAEKTVAELEERRRTQADRLGGPEAWCGEAKIVDPDRRTVRRCYLFSKDEPLEWDDRTPDEDQAEIVAVNQTASVTTPPRLAEPRCPQAVVTRHIYVLTSQLNTPPTRNRRPRWYDELDLEVGFVLATVHGWRTLRRRRHRASPQDLVGARNRSPQQIDRMERRWT